MRGRLVLLNSIAHSLIRLSPTQNISLSHFDVETEYKVNRANLSFDGSYQYATPREDAKRLRDLRVFTVTIPVMRYYFGSQGQLLIDYERATNFAWLEWMYNIHKTVKPFLFDHPVYGSLMVRFAEPLKVPKGTKGGQAALEGVSITLIEVQDTTKVNETRISALYLMTNVLGPLHYINVDKDYWVTDNRDIFDYPYHLISTEYEAEDTSLTLGGNYQYVVRGSKPEERVFTLYFEGLKYELNQGELLSYVSGDSQLSMHHLENFYYWFRLDIPFYYIHPTYGKIKVRFKEPLKIPKLRANGNGWTESFTVTLVEVIEDAHRYV